MRQVNDSELRFLIKFELGQLRVATFKAMASGHQETRTRALEAATDRIVRRMAPWEILAPEPIENIFRDLTPGEKLPGAGGQ